ncbi:DUF4442 domain-containing protein [Corynebacterium sp. 320]|uniref:DUF4442 domain-containing protein n=1 Tax=Corynebacterium zhongnanshanii TaxID=2768834 RepID=A0ABQ6VBU4_9CORY|nr:MULTISPECIES: hotdog fold domain-containing protein [Corynebacterium]KAB1502765.1 DUF4442 domain-containing protein [Corynebacterium sp. 320]KAB1550495.1 DUF4442 domain-containing protein [Corynebacterium sp. 319]KAB1554775.1 DUF4442 domain-containing protein [Corynebacterium sp. 321]KAB3519216.1 DUF4442 domain-containing protein [Corynebacterium zhongnanshanii]KAB3526428.1 DUF4442 domain-containing protein [Corynebacterium sp. 250]
MSSPLAGNPRPNANAKLYEKLAKKPLGTRLFGALVAFKAPFFMTSQPQLKTLRPGLAEVRLTKWWLMQNHIGTFHVISALNGAEFAMGCLAEISLPDTHRWLPQGMTTEYKAKSTGGLTLTATMDLPDFSTITKETGGRRIPVTIKFVDDAGQEPMTATIDIWVTAKS